jgi:hypothetical protein
MIVVKLMGGMGNQLFQYAAGRALSLRHNTKLYIDTSFLEANSNKAYTQRDYELGAFNIQAELLPMEMKRVINHQIKNSWLSRFREKLGISDSLKTYSEQGHQYNSIFVSLPDNTYLSGFWQSEMYFEYFEEVIRKELKIKSEFITGIESYEDMLRVGRSVSLHVRRGDYVNLKSASDFHGVCDLNLYEKALLILKKKYGDLRVIIFSDDIPWCKENLKIPIEKYFIETDSAVKDLFLMQKCDHHIIANSSFSWWGAWLNPNKEKTVIAPLKWFNSNEVDTRNIVPESWIRI